MKQEKNKPAYEEITLSSKQLKGLDMLGKIDFDSVFSTKKLSWVGKFFQWLDMNIFDKSSRAWMYLLEAAGVVAIFMILNDVRIGLHQIASSKSELELKIATTYINSVVTLAPAIATMVATICGALPTVIGIMRSLNTKWKAGNGTSLPSSTNSPGTPPGNTPVA